MGQKLTLTARGPQEGTLGCSEFDAAALSDAAEVLASDYPVLRSYGHELGSVDVYLEPDRKKKRLLVLSASPIALHLLRFAAQLGYETTLVEGRVDRVNARHRDEATAVARSLDEVDLGLGWDAVATDHDDPALAAALTALLKAPTGYLGVMGSKRHVGPYIDHLRAAGFDDADLARIDTPAGVPIGSRDDAEIALSMAAGLVAHHRTD